MSCHNCDCFECEAVNREAALDANEVLYNQPQPYREPTAMERALVAHFAPYIKRLFEPSPLLDYIERGDAPNGGTFTIPIHDARRVK